MGMVLEMVTVIREGTDDFEVTFFRGSSWGIRVRGYGDLSIEIETTPFEREIEIVNIFTLFFTMLVTCKSNLYKY